MKASRSPHASSRVAAIYREGQDAQRFQTALSNLIASDDPFGKFVGENLADIFGVDAVEFLHG